MDERKFFNTLKESLNREFLVVIADKKRNVYSQFMFSENLLRWEIVSNRWLKKKKLSKDDEQQLFQMGF